MMPPWRKPFFKISWNSNTQKKNPDHLFWDLLKISTEVFCCFFVFYSHWLHSPTWKNVNLLAVGKINRPTPSHQNAPRIVAVSNQRSLETNLKMAWWLLSITWLILNLVHKGVFSVCKYPDFFLSSMQTQTEPRLTLILNSTTVV